MENETLMRIYDELLKQYGPQGWWPLTIRNHKSEHHSGRPKTNNHKFEIIMGAILTQNTSWKNVEKALHSLSKNNLIDASNISNAKQETIAGLIRPAGYYNQKAERLKIISDYISKKYNEDISSFFKKDIDELRAELLSIKGIGPETADSIMLYAAEKPVFVIDAYTRRIFQVLGFKAKTYDEWQGLFMKNLKHDTKMFKEYHALLVALGKDLKNQKGEEIISKLKTRACLKNWENSSHGEVATTMAETDRGKPPRGGR